MGAGYYGADTENGDHIDDPCEDALYMLLGDLNETDNTFLVVNPANDALTWRHRSLDARRAVVEIVRRDPSRHEHDVTVEADIDRIARDLTIWLARRSYRSAV